MSSLTETIKNRFGVPDFYDGEWYSIKCPLHNDDTPSAGLNFESKMFNCLSSCGAMPFIALAKKLDIDYSDIETVNEDFNDFLNDLIEDQTKSRPLVLRKQVEAYTNFLLERKIKPETVEEFGGYYVSDESHQDYGYLVVPYQTSKGTKTVRRRIAGNGDRFKQSPNDGDGDSKALFGKGFNNYNTVILVEGITDLFTVWEHHKNVVASFGCKFTKQQGYLLRNKIVFILYDRDYEGFAGAKKAAEILREFNCTVIILEIPETFSDGTTNKIDANSAYCFDSNRFFGWLQSELNRYSSYDRAYIIDTFKPNSIEDSNKLCQFKTGIDGLDSILNGGFASGIHGIKGRSGIGKSSLVAELTDQASDQGLRVLSLSYELSKRQMWSRQASRYSMHNFAEIEKDSSILEMEAFNKINELGNNVKIELGWNIDQIIAAIDNFEVVIVDYIQRMEFEGSDTRKGIDLNMGKLSNLARDKNKIIFIISSMAEGQDNFKESGSILYMCQTAFCLKRINANTLVLSNEKNTRGKQGDNIYLDVDFGHQRAKECSPPELKEFVK